MKEKANYPNNKKNNNKIDNFLAFRRKAKMAEYEPFVEFGLEGTTAGLKTVRVTLGFLASLTIALAAVATVEDGDFRFLSFFFLFFLLSLLSFL